MEAGETSEDGSINLSAKGREEQEVMSLLTSLVKTHYLEKSNKFHMAMDFEKLFKLDRLDQLKHLEELEKLRALDDLKSLEQLKELSKLRELSHLSELKPLAHLEKLEELRELAKLDRLNSLHQLDKLAELESLNRLTELKDLEKLSSIATLNKLIENHKDVLLPLIHLDRLVELEKLQNLNQLSNLENLNKLEDLSKLDKLDRLNDMRFAERLDKLDKLNILEKGTKTLVAQQFISFGFEILKLALAGLVIVFLLSRETGREIAIKTLPALGFGSGAQVNLGLKLLLGETSPERFQAVVSDVKKRIDSEIDSAFSSSPSLTIQRRLELIDQLLSYSFQGAGTDLSNEVKIKLEEKLSKLIDTAASRIEYDMALARGKQDTKTESKLREIKLLLIQKQYPQLLEKVLPLWGTSEGLTKAATAGTVALKLQDPGTLEEILRKMPGSGAL